MNNDNVKIVINSKKKEYEKEGKKIEFYEFGFYKLDDNEL